MFALGPAKRAAPPASSLRSVARRGGCSDRFDEDGRPLTATVGCWPALAGCPRGRQQDMAGHHRGSARPLLPRIVPGRLGGMPEKCGLATAASGHACQTRAACSRYRILCAAWQVIATLKNVETPLGMGYVQVCAADGLLLEHAVPLSGWALIPILPSQDARVVESARLGVGKQVKYPQRFIRNASNRVVPVCSRPPPQSVCPFKSESLIGLRKP